MNKLGKIRIDAAYAAKDFAALAYEFSPVGLVITEARVIRGCNPEFERMFGYAPGELTDALFEVLYPSKDEFVKIRDRGVEDLRATNTYWDERVMMRKDGTLFWCRTRGHSLTPENDPLGRAVWSFADLSGHRPYQPLTPREREVVNLLAEGMTSKEIARELEISPRTVEVHRAKLQKKFAVTNTNALLQAMSGVPPERIVAR
ncbi:LuxR C-terminal-related transcriptional regulator [Maritimibacter sp. DP1N21-5]|uniref:LuxR C-terminal-related transcriptional regulator n=1 Tax=Maritimibacter sp. DP1N21-5 TaxID=2836867 RepID=UPI001C453CBD|nr:LuxR C-terminal-related transcriptional regulator [Maritimibacter sp. DP1N21-5]MBV7407981.1 PAS and helix-turn-helix domain-containing protein [Maritimibacter sp. DP1N21-5]